MNEKNENEKSFLSYLENGEKDSDNSNNFLEKLDLAVRSVKENLEFRYKYLKIK